MKAVSMFNCICSLGLALTCVLLLLGSPQAADAQSAPADASNIETLTSPSATFDSVEVVQGGKILKLRADGAAVDVQSQTHSLYLHSSGPGACPHACNNVLINPFGGEGNVGIGTIERAKNCIFLATVSACKMAARFSICVPTGVTSILKAQPTIYISPVPKTLL